MVAFVAGIGFVGYVASRACTTGMYVAAAIAGATDVDAITLSTANLAKQGSTCASPPRPS